MDPAASITVLGAFPSGLYVITVTYGGEEHGMTANWVMPAAFTPPMVAVSLENTSKTLQLVRDARHFGVSVLQSGQRDLAAKLGRPSDEAPQKLKGIKLKRAAVAATPVLADALGWVECRLVATLPAGDHTIALGEVVDAGVEQAGARALTLQETGLNYQR